MCGRYTLSAPPATLAEWFDLEAPVPELAVRYNIAPSQPVPVILNERPRAIALVRWGLIPAGARDPSVGHRMINARAETVALRPAFRDAFRDRRCLVVADGFYEWRVNADGTRTPMLIRRHDGRPIAFAGVWEEWQPPSGTPIRSCTILTTTPNAVLAPIHDRMPVLLPRAAFGAWLAANATPRAALATWLVPCPDDLLVAHAVSRLVNDPRVDTIECTTPA